MVTTVPPAGTIPGYTLLQKCGRGACGDVYIARDIAGRRVALKIIEGDTQSSREMQGLRSSAELQDFTHLIKIYHIGEDKGVFYYSMELADALETAPYLPATLGNVLKQRHHLPPGEVITLGKQILAGISTLHEANLIHRDIKPDNLLFVNNVLKLSDLGLLRTETASLSVGGTLGFIPPERLHCAQGCISREDDLYAAGKVLYCMLSGNAPERFPELPPELLSSPAASKLNRILLTACDAIPDRRFHSAAQFSLALEQLALPPPPRRRLSKKYLLLLPILLAALPFYRFLSSPPPVPEKSQLAIEPLPQQQNKRHYSISVSSGTPENTVIYSFAENSSSTGKPQQRKLLVSDRFTDNKIWAINAAHNIVRKFNTLSLNDYAEGEIKFLPQLPENYALTFTMKADKLTAPLICTITSASGKEKLEWDFSGTPEGVLPSSLKYFRNGSVIASYRQRKNGRLRFRQKTKVEILRTPERMEVRLNGKIAFTAPAFFPGGKFMFHASGGNCKVEIQNFQLHHRQ